MADLGDTPAQQHNPAVARIADGLTVLLGSSYAPDTLAQKSTNAERYERLSARIAAVESHRQRNLEAVAEAAYEAASENRDEQAADILDSDWLARFVELAQRVGNVDMQQVWGHVLACECQMQGRVSFQALDVLSGMTSKALDLLERAGRMYLPSGYLLKIAGRNAFADFDMDEDAISHLQSLNIIQELDDLSVTFYAPTKGITFDFKGGDLIVRHPTSQLFILPAYRFTRTGRELMAVLADVPVDMAYLAKLGQDLKGQGYDYRVRDAQGALIEHV